MNRPRILRPEVGLLPLVVACVAPLALPDTWLPPKKRTYCAKDKKVCFEVIPRDLASPLQYFQDKVEGRADAGLPEDATERRCRGVLYRKRALGRRKVIWAGRLVNEISPVSALVSANGQYVVTFDNWYSVGYGDDVVVIYGPRGNLIRKFSLEELLGKDVSRVGHSVSSRWWSGGSSDPHYIDEKNEVVVLTAVLYETVKTRLGTREVELRKKDSHPERRKIRIALATGEILPEG